MSGIIVSTDFTWEDEVVELDDNRVDVLRSSTEVLCCIKVDVCSDVGDTSGVLFLRAVESVCLFGYLLVVGNAFELSCTVVSGNVACISVAVEIRPSDVQQFGGCIRHHSLNQFSLSG